MILLIHPRRGLFQLTTCNHCGYVFDCENCTNKLTTYRTHQTKLELVCSQCQSYYNYPKRCPKCGSDQIDSKFSGIDDLTEYIQKDLKKKVIRLDELKVFEKQQEQFVLKNKEKVFLTTRVFDPAIDYSFFEKVVFIQAQNLIASSDYLVKEDIFKNLTELFLRLKPEAKVLFDTQSPELSFFQDFLKLNKAQNRQQIINWYFSFLKQEAVRRQGFLYPPHQNLVLLTSQENQLQKSIHKIKMAKSLILDKRNFFQEIKVGNYYPARFLKRKNMYSHHLLIRFEKHYPKFKSLKQFLKDVGESCNLQVRLNPSHIF